MIDTTFGPFALYLGRCPGVGDSRSRDELELRVAVTIGPRTLLKGALVLARF